MITSEVLLISGRIINVRRLGMFELDDVPKDIPAAYTVSILFAGGEVYEQQIDLSYSRPKPDKPFESCAENDAEYYDWREYYTWQDGLVHSRNQYEAYCDYCEQVASYIMRYCILTDDLSASEIVTEDWPKIYQAAFCPQVTMEDISASMRDNF